MKKILFIFSLTTVLNNLFAQELSYYLPESVSYNPAIPKPKEIIHHEVGEWHITHDRLVNYMSAIALTAPDRVKIETMGFTYERRPQVLLIITSPKNHQRLEEIRKQHLLLSDPKASASVNIDNMPIVVWIGHSIHGNEASGSNASLLSAYYLAAAQGKAIDELLENTVILFDPSFNPDGLQRFSTWVNQHKSKNLVTNPSSREFNEVWPGGRFNHYWFDLNRDWLPSVHVESQNRLQWFHRWNPNILTDHHEQGSNASFFFQPGVPSRVNPLTPEKNQELTGKLGKYHAKFLDKIGSLYFTKENYDDFYYGKGSTYPDINGAIGILFEQASSRGHAQQTSNGILKFQFTIKNQFTATLSTLEGAKELRKEFLEWQREFYKSSMEESATSSIKGYVFGDATDISKTKLFIQMLQRHQIKVFELQKDFVVDGQKFQKGHHYLIPSNQSKYKIIRTIFDKTLAYKDSLFYDITSWTMPLAFGLDYKELTADLYNAAQQGSLVENAESKVESKIKKSDYAYIVRWDNLYAPAALFELQSSGLITKVATSPIQLEINGEKHSFDYGSILIPVKIQNLSSEKTFEILENVSKKYELSITEVNSGTSVVGVDLGSSKFLSLTKPSLAMLVGTGINATDAGEIWHLLDQRMNIPSTHLEIATFNQTDLSKFNSMILVGGNYANLIKEKLKTWVQEGGVLILTEEAVSWAAQNGISDVKFKKPKIAVDSTARVSYIEREQIDGAQQMSGAIFGAQIDLTHPLAYGYNQKMVSLFKANKVFMEKSKNPYATPFFYGTTPLQSGWISKENKDAIKNTASVVVNTIGSGRIINIADNPNFRAFWLGGTKLFMNAIFFGNIIESASARTEE